MRIHPTKTVDELFIALSFIIDVEGNRKLYHAWRVAILASQFARRMSSLQRKYVFYASLLHDLGGVGLTKHIVHFLRQETKTSQVILLSHPIIGAQLIAMLPNISPVSKLIMDHHEWVDGLGYPRGKSGQSICEEAQCIRIADSVDIAIRFGHSRKLSAMKKRLKHAANREVSEKVAKFALSAINKDKFFYSVLDLENVPIIFEKIKKEIEPIKMPLRVDVIGRTLEIVAQVIDMKHPFTAGHSVRVSRYALAIALALRLDHDEVTRIKWAGLIHDIGKLSIPRKILDKPTKLTKKEFFRIKKHPEITEKILGMIPSLKNIAAVASGHHEYFNGSGYPYGLRGHQSQLGARILTLCDAFDAMTSNRPYRNPMTAVSACKEIKKLAGIQFDPEIVKVALPLFKNLGL
jgi:HD-GYP domain-containing protein (c-di-GMP phosphodiesterase class II)